MPPKNKSLEDLVATLSTQLETITEEIKKVRERLDGHDEKFTCLETLLTEYKNENTKLKEAYETQKEEIISLKDHVNRLEQRNWDNCIRIFNLPISGDSSDNNVVAEEVYNKVLKPVFLGAASKGRLPGLPTIDKIIDTAHILPGKKDIKPIICRFRKPVYKNIFMQLKRDLAPRAASKGDRPGPMLYPAFDDTTRDTYLLMRKLSNNARVESSWYAGGALKFRLVDSNDICKVRSICGPYESHFPPASGPSTGN